MFLNAMKIVHLLAVTILSVAPLVAGQPYRTDACAVEPPSGGDSASCLEILACIEEYTGLCTSLDLSSDILEAIDNTTDVTYNELDTRFKSVLCSIFDTPELRASGDDPCSILSDDGRRRRGLQGDMLVDPDYPFSELGPMDYETLVLGKIGDFLTPNPDSVVPFRDKRTDADKYAVWVFDTLPKRRETLATRKQSCSTADQVVDGVGALLSAIPLVGSAISGVFSSQKTGVCNTYLLRDEREVTFAELVQTTMDVHDALIDSAEIEAANTNIRVIGLHVGLANMQLSDLTRTNQEGQQRIETQVNDLARTNQEGQQQIETQVSDLSRANQEGQQRIEMKLDALSGRQDELEMAVAGIAEDIDSNFRALSLRLDELETSIKNAIALATATDAAVTILTNLVQSWLAQEGNSGKRNKGSRRARKRHLVKLDDAVV